jgi:hypothetical protein
LVSGTHTKILMVICTPAIFAAGVRWKPTSRLRPSATHAARSAGTPYLSAAGSSASASVRECNTIIDARTDAAARRRE